MPGAWSMLGRACMLLCGAGVHLGAGWVSPAQLMAPVARAFLASSARGGARTVGDGERTKETGGLTEDREGGDPRRRRKNGRSPISGATS